MAVMRGAEREPASRDARPAPAAAAPAPPSVQQILTLQRGAGNAAVAAMLARAPLQRSFLDDLTGDADEREDGGCEGGCGGGCGGACGGAAGEPSMLDSVLEAGQEVGAQIGGFVSGLLTPEEPGHDADTDVGRQSERAAAMLADTRGRLAGLEQVTFTAAELATINSCVARLRGQGVELPGLIEPEDVGEGLFDVAGTSLAALATAIPMPLPIPLPGPWLILGIIALIILLLLTLMRGIERARERERERERDRDRTGPPCRGASALLDDVRALLTRTIEQDAEIFLRYHIGRDPTTCSDPSNQRRLRSRYFWHMLHVCQVGVMQACDRQGRLLAYAPGVKGVGTGGALHAEDIALRAIEPMLLAIPMPARAGGQLWSVTIDRACGRCNPTVTGAAATLLAGTPVFAHLGSRFMELRSRTDPAFDLAWAKLCAGAPAPGPGPGPAPAPTGMAVPAEDEEPAEEELVIA